MSRYLRYTSFPPEELERRLRELAPPNTPSCLLHIPRHGTGWRVNSHTFAITFPDGKPGTCRYERGGPRWHLFHFLHAEGEPMPRQTSTERLPNDVPSLEQKGRELAGACYREAICRERQHYFQRASEPADGSRKRRPACYRLKPQKAKELAGKYALCQPLGAHLVAMSKPYEDIEQANQAWRERGDPRLVVACCNRLDRCWELPRYNALYAEFDPRATKCPSQEEATVPEAIASDEGAEEGG